MIVVQITLSYFCHGAVMRRARQETKALLDAGHQVIVITDLRWKSCVHEIWDYKKELKIIPIKPFYIHRPFRMVSHQLSFALRTIFALRKLAKKEKIDLIVSHASTICLAVAPFAKKKKIPSVWVIQDLIKYRKVTGNPYNLIETVLLKFSDPFAIKNMKYLLPVSEYTQKLIIEEGALPENVYIMNNTVNTEKFTPNENIQKDIDILFFGRLSIEKGVDILIEATKNLSNDKRIVIIGDGPLKPYLVSMANKIGKNIEFWGFIDHSKLPNIIPRAKIVIAPSRSECHAAVPMESMSCGVPVIASKVAGMEDTIHSGKNGWLLTENNPKTLGNLMEKVLSNPQKLKNFSDAAIKRAYIFSEKKFKKDIVKLYEKFKINNKSNK